jgi:predicted nucleotidyltransferase
VTIPQQQTERLLEVLADSGLDFVVIGGVAAIAHGATTATQDLDIAMQLDPGKVRQLLEALAPYKPVHFTRPELPLVAENADSLAKFRLLLVETELGRLDILSEVEPFERVSDLPTVQLPLLPERLFEVIDLDALIELKAHVGRGKDKILEEELRAVRERLWNTSDDE